MDREDNFIVVANTKGKADIWRHFVLEKRKYDGTILDKVAVCKTCNSTIRLPVVLPIESAKRATTHLRRYHPQLLSSGSMQAKSTPKPPSTNQAAASTSSGLTQPASQQQRQQTLWNQTHQLEQTVSADSVEPDTSATPPQLPTVSLAAEETPVESVKVDQLLEDGRATKNTNVPAGHSSDRRTCHTRGARQERISAGH